MNRFMAFLLSFIFLFLISGAIAEDNTKAVEVPDGMEVVPIGGGGSQLVVPKGAKIRKVGAQIIVEGTKEYMSRMVSTLEERITKLEESQATLKKEVEVLKSKLNEKKNEQTSVEVPVSLNIPSDTAEPAQQEIEKQKLDVLEGKVIKVDAVGQKLVVRSFNKELSFSVSDDAQINRGADSIKLHGVYDNDSVKISYETTSSGTYVAREIMDFTPSR